MSGLKSYPSPFHFLGAGFVATARFCAVVFLLLMISGTGASAQSISVFGPANPVTEGEDAVFTVNLVDLQPSNHEIRWETSLPNSGSNLATPGTDFRESGSTVLDFTDLSPQMIRVETLTDDIDEENEIFSITVTLVMKGTDEIILTTSAQATIANNSPATGLPTISGTPRVGETLTANTSGISDADGPDPLPFTYQWNRRSSGGTDTAIGSATSATYTLVAGDEGDQITVSVRYTDAGGTDEGPLTSAPTAAVAMMSPPDLSGTTTPLAITPGGTVVIFPDLVVRDADANPRIMRIRVENPNDLNASDIMAFSGTPNTSGFQHQFFSGAEILGAPGNDILFSAFASGTAADRWHDLLRNITFAAPAGSGGRELRLFVEVQYGLNDPASPDTLTRTLTIGAAATNTPPTTTGLTVMTAEDTPYTFAAGNFNFDDTNSGDSLAAVRIVTLPDSASGSLALGTGTSATPVNPAQVIAVADIPTLVYTPVDNVNGNATFTFSVSDGTAFSATPATATVSVTPVNDAPTISGLPDKTVVQGAAYSFMPRGDDVDDDTLVYAITNMPSWASFSTTTGALTGTPASTDVANYENIIITVTDNIIATPVALSAFAIAVTATAGTNMPPTADAGANQRWDKGTEVTLDGTGSDDPNGDNLIYLWSQDAGATTVTLSDTTAAQPTFTIPTVIPTNPASYTFSLVVSDGQASSTNEATVRIFIRPLFQATIANQTFTAGNAITPITLPEARDGPGSVPSTNTYTLAPLPAGLAFDSASRTLSGTPTSVGTFNLTYTATNEDGHTDSLSFSIEVAANVPPTANAGADQTVAEGASVTLDGSGSSDSEGENLTYAWTQVGTPMVSLSDADTATPTFTAPADLLNDATLEFSLVVNDGTNASAAATVTITITGVNDPPIANAGPDQNNIAEGASVTLNGSGSSDSDSDNSALTYAWTQVGTATVTLNGADTATPTFTAPADLLTDATLEFSLVVNDGANDSVADSVIIAITGENVAPTANAGPNQRWGQGTKVTLDGTGSTDPDGDNLSYLWSQDAGPTTVTLSDTTAAQPTFTIPTAIPKNVPALYTFILVVNDGALSSTNHEEVSSNNEATVRIFVRPLFHDTIDNQTYSVGSAITDLTLPTAQGGPASLPSTNTYTLAPLPPGLTFNTASRILSGTPTTAGTSNLTYTATNEDGHTDSLGFSITVTSDTAPPNTPPTTSGLTVSTKEDTAHRFAAGEFNFADADTGDSLVEVRIDSLPAPASLGSLALNGTPVNVAQVIAVADIPNLLYTPATDTTGTVTFTFSVSDGTDFSVAPAMATLYIVAVGTPTTSDLTVTTAEDTSYTFEADNFPFDDTDSGDTLQQVRIDSLPDSANGSLTLNNIPVTVIQVIPVADIPTLVYTPVANVNGVATFTFSVSDGTAFSTPPATATLTVTPVNDVATGGAVTGDDRRVGATLTADISTIEDADGLPTDASAFSYQWLGFGLTPIANANSTTYTLTEDNVGGPIYLDIRFTDLQNNAEDLLLAALGGLPVVRRTNTPPTTSGLEVTVFENTPYTFAAGNPGFSMADDFNFADADGVSNALQQVRIDSLPTPTSLGDLRLNGVAVTVTQVIAVADIPTLVYTPATDTTGTATFTFSVSDGTDFSVAPAMGTLNIVTTDSPPTSSGLTVTVFEGTSHNFELAEFNFADADGATLHSLRIDSLPATGFLFLNSTPVNAGQVLPVHHIGILLYNPVINSAGTVASFTYSVFDGTDYSAAPATATLNIVATGTPTTRDLTVTTLEDTAYTFKEADFTFRNGGASGSLQAVRIDSLPAPASGSLALGGTAVTATQVIPVANIPTLVYTPATNVHGAATFTFSVSDGTDFSATATAIVSVTQVNDPATGRPTIGNIPSNLPTTGALLVAFTHAFRDVDGRPIQSTFTYQWNRHDAGMDTPIVGATSNLYTTTLDDVGARITVTVSFTDNDGNAESATSLPTQAVVRGNASPTGKPTIDGDLIQGQTLTVNTADLGDPNGLPDRSTFTYIWAARAGSMGDFTIISGATSATYTLTQAEVGKSIFANVSYRDDDGTDEDLNTETRGPIANINDSPSGSVTIGGTPVAGQPLSADTTALVDIDGLPDPSMFTYRWLAGSNPISNATLSTYTLTDAEIGQMIRVEVSYTDNFNAPESITSAPTAAVVAANTSNTPPTGTPVISGTTTEGEPLTVDTSGISDADGLNNVVFSYQWNRHAAGTDTAISSATSATYLLAGGDVGEMITVTVSFTDNQNNPESLTSAPTAAVAAASTSNTPPTTSAFTVSTNEDSDYTFGLADFPFSDVDAGNSLAAVRIDSLPASASGSLALGGTAVTATQVIPVANIPTLVYTPATNVHGAATFTFSVSDGTDFSAAATAIVSVTQVNDPATGRPTIGNIPSNLPTTGALLVAFTHAFRDVDGRPIQSTFTYQWNRHDAGMDTPIVGATSNLYTTTLDDVGARITVTVSFTDNDGNAESATSLPTQAVVRGNASPTGKPTIDGDLIQGQTLTVNTADLGDPNGLPDRSTFTYIWAARAGSMGDFTIISGATSATYTLTQAEVGKSIFANVSYRDDDGTDEDLNTETRGPIANINDSPSGSVTIGGTPVARQPLSADTTALVDIDGLPDPSMFTYRWLAGSNPISNATLSTYILTDAEIGQMIRVEVSYTDNFNAPESITSAPTAAVVAANTSNTPPTGTPVISGTTTEGESLTVDTSGISDADGLNNVVFSYQWNRHAAGTDTAISSATSATYLLAGGDVGEMITVTVSFTDNQNNPEILTSAPTAAVAAASTTNTPPTTSAFTVSTNEDSDYTFGLADFPFSDVDAGNSLAAVRIATLPASASGSLALNGTAVIATQVIPVANIPTLVYTPATNVHGAATFTFSVSDGTDFSATATATVSVTQVNDPATGRPTIIHNTPPATFSRLTVNTRAVRDVDGRPSSSDLTHQWNRHDAGVDTAIVGAISFGYTMTLDDIGARITVTVSFTDNDGNNESVTSLPTQPVVKGDALPTGALTIDGDLIQGQTLTVNTDDLGDLNGLPDSSTFTYRWAARVGSAGSFTPISGANSATYTLTQAEVGKWLFAEVSYRDDDDYDGSISTALRGPVANINDAPTGSGFTVSTNEDSDYTFAVANFPFADDDGDSLAEVRIDSLPASANGSLALGTGTSATPVNIAQVIAVADIPTLVYTPVDNVNGNATFTFSVSDGTAFSATPATATVSVTPVNDAPTISGLPDKTVVQGAAYSFMPRGDDVDDDTLVYAITNMPSWASFSTTTGALTGTPASTDVANYENIIITVTDNIIATPVALSAFAIAVTATAGTNMPPTADAGANQRWDKGTEVTLDGTGSDDPNGDNLIYLWSQDAGATTVTLSDTTAAQPTFTIPTVIPTNPASYTFSLVVSDGQASSTNEATVRIFIRPLFQATIANQTFTAGNAITPITLPEARDGPGSVPSTNTYTLAPLPAGLAFDSASRTLSGTPTSVGTFNLTYTATNEDGHTDSLSFSIEVAANVPPTANAGADQTVAEGASVTLDGSGSSDSEGENLTYAWTQVGTPMVSLSDADTATPTFTAPADLLNDATLEFSLVVNDGTNASAAATVTITITGVNDPPIANAGPDQNNIAEGASVTLDGSGSSDSDSDNSALTYAWTQVGTATVTLSDADTATPTFTAPADLLTDATLEFSLVVNDGTNDSAADSVIIAITGENDAPTANAGSDQRWGKGTEVTLDGTGSTDPDGDNLTYLWSQGTSATRVTLSDTTAAQPTFTIPNVIPEGPALYTFILVVNDGALSSTNHEEVSSNNEATVRIFVRPLFRDTIDTQTYSLGSAITDLILPTAQSGPSSLPSTNTYTLAPLPPGLTFNTASRILSGTPTTAGTSNLTYTATNGDGHTDSLGFSITVTSDTAPPNTPPTTSGLTVSTKEDTAHSFTAAEFTFADADTGDSLQQVRIDSLPDSANGSLTLNNIPVTVIQVIPVADIPTLVYTPVTNVNGTASFTFSVSDGTAFSTPPATATLTVTAVNDAPTISGTPATSVAEDSAYSFTPTGGDDDGDTLTYAITNMPSWASFSTATGALTGTPVNADVGDHEDIVISVTDGIIATPVALASFDIAVTNTNDAPVGLPTITNLAGAGRAPEPGHPLLAGTSAITDEDGLRDATFTYQWNRGFQGTDTPIVGATSAFYTVQQSDVGKTISVTVSYTDDRGTPESVTSAPTQVGEANIRHEGFPSILGTITEDETLTAVTDAITDANGIPDPPVFTYEWQALDGLVDRNPRTIAGATSKTYTLTQAEVGKHIGVIVTFRDSGGNLETPRRSFVRGPVLNVNDAPVGLPTITGTATEDETLTAVTDAITDEDGLLSATFSYQWQADGVDISGADSGTYVLTQAEVGNGIRVTVSYTDDRGTPESLTSAATSAVVNVNDAPTSSGLAVSTEEDTAHSFAAGEFTFADADGDALHSLRIDTLPATGTLTLDGAAVTAGDVIPAAGIGTLVYTPAANATGDVSFTFSLSDGTAFGAPATATITIGGENNAPTSSGLAVTTEEDTAHSFTAAEFTFADADGDALHSLRICDPRRRDRDPRLYPGRQCHRRCHLHLQPQRWHRLWCNRHGNRQHYRGQ